jgi:hypothetical protein
MNPRAGPWAQYPRIIGRNSQCNVDDETPPEKNDRQVTRDKITKFIILTVTNTGTRSLSANKTNNIARSIIAKIPTPI